jgi:glycosyltransferase involved in cell wall biosynthesis
MKIALVHDYMMQNGGAEQVCETILGIYPTADVYTTVYNPANFKSQQNINKAYEEKRIKTSFLNNLFVKNEQASYFSKFSKHLYFVYPTAMTTLLVQDYDLVIISSTYCGKNVRLKNNKKVIHYCHSPVRFLYNLVTEKDHETLPLWQKLVSRYILNPILKIQDLGAVRNLISKDTIWVSNSKFIRETVNQVYHVDSDVIYPPVKIDSFSQIVKSIDQSQEEYYFCHGRISFHKRLDLAILACLQLNKKLFISGTSALDSDMDNLRSLIPKDKSHLITFLGRTQDEQLKELISKSKGMIFPGKEDAGIAPLEVIATGTGVIAYGSGGALEWLENHVNGVLFYDQTVESLVEAIIEFEDLTLDPIKVKRSVDRFSEKHFIEEFKNI